LLHQAGIQGEKTSSAAYIRMEAKPDSQAQWTLPQTIAGATTATNPMHIKRNSNQIE